MEASKYFLLVGLLLAFLLSFSDASATPQEKLQEKVSVVNIEVPLRVYSQGKPRAGLQKSDFRLFASGREIEINGFYEVHKKLEITPAEQQLVEGRAEPRLFLLIFNISDYNLDMKKALETLFHKIIRPGDRVMVLSNSFFFGDRIIRDTSAEVEKINTILKLEARKIRASLFSIENSVVHMAENLQEELQQQVEGLNLFIMSQIDPAEFYSRMRRFYDLYLRYLKEFRTIYLNLDVDQYASMAEYLRRQKLEKWVLNFYQYGVFPKLKSSGLLGRFIQRQTASMESGLGDQAQEIGRMFQDLLLDVETELFAGGERPQTDLGKLFLDSQATFHTVLMNPVDRRNLADFEYVPIGLKSENLLRDITDLTGGKTVRTNLAEEFFRQIAGSEDIYYVLTYAPDETLPKNRQKIRIEVNREGCRLIYDDQQREQYFREMVDRQKRESPQIRFENLEFKEKVLSFSLWEFVRDESKKGGRVEVRIQVADEKGKVVMDRKHEFQPGTDGEAIQIRIVELKKGNYDLLVEATDILSGSKDLAIRNIIVK